MTFYQANHSVDNRGGRCMDSCAWFAGVGGLTPRESVPHSGSDISPSLRAVRRTVGCIRVADPRRAGVMAETRLGAVVRLLYRIADGRPADEPTDGQLLERFAAGRDPDAFEALVRRHGPMVRGVRRRAL